MTSSHRVPPFPSWNSLITLVSWILQIDIWELIEGYSEKGNILRLKLERSLLRNRIAMCECNPKVYTFLLHDQLANIGLWKSAGGYLLDTSQSYTFVFTDQLLTQFSGDLQLDTS